MKFDDCYIACICEGGAEEAIIEILLDNDKLKFTRNDLLYNELISDRSAKKFSSKYLTNTYEKSIIVIRVLDSENENFEIKAPYSDKIKDVINVITKREIEMLIIHSEGQYNEYKKQKEKPSVFCKGMKIGYSKSREFYFNYYKDVDKLIKSLKDYKSCAQNNIVTIADLLK